MLGVYALKNLLDSHGPNTDQTDQGQRYQFDGFSLILTVLDDEYRINYFIHWEVFPFNVLLYLYCCFQNCFNTLSENQYSLSLKEEL